VLEPGGAMQFIILQFVKRNGWQWHPCSISNVKVDKSIMETLERIRAEKAKHEKKKLSLFPNISDNIIPAPYHGTA
jgi:hypothetical protein